MKRPLSLLEKGLRNPSRIPSYLNRKQTELSKKIQNEIFRRRNSIEHQKPRIQEFTAQDEFALIILDSCRYDAFKSVYPNYFSGDLLQVWSSGHWTGDYVRNTWNEYHDLTYVNAAPVVSDFYFTNRASGPNPEQYFRDVIHVWETEWDDERGTTPAEDVTDVALRETDGVDHPRLIAHYIQPHFPYVGEYRIDELEGGYDHIRNRVDDSGPSMIEQWLERADSAAVSIDEIKRAYKSNLIYVMEEVRRLVNALDCPVVITADHGEHVGREGRFLHQESTPYTRTVPWFRVESMVGAGDEDPLAELRSREDKEIQSVDDDTVEQRLADLGYVE